MALWGQTTEKEQFHETELTQLPLYFDSLFNKLDCSERLERKATFKEFSQEGDSNRSNGSLSNNLKELREALKSGIKRMEAQQYEELRQRSEVEVKVGLLEAQLQDREESLRSKESARKQLEENLTSKIQELEHRLTEKEDLLEEASQEVMNFRAEAEAIFLRLQAQLQGNGAHLDTREAELIDHTSRVAPLDGLPEGFVTLRENMVVSLNLLEKKPVENAVYPTELGEEQKLKSMAAEIEKLRVEVREKDVLVAAREMQLRLIKQALVEKVRDLERTIHRQVTFRLIATSA